MDLQRSRHRGFTIHFLFFFLTPRFYRAGRFSAAAAPPLFIWLSRVTLSRAAGRCAQQRNPPPFRRNSTAALPRRAEISEEKTKKTSRTTATACRVTRRLPYNLRTPSFSTCPKGRLPANTTRLPRCLGCTYACHSLTSPSHVPRCGRREPGFPTNPGQPPPRTPAPAADASYVCLICAQSLWQHMYSERICNPPGRWTRDGREI